MIIKRLPLLIAAGVGYVFGAKAGRERYEQLRSQFDKVRNDPRVQEKTQQAADLAKEKAPVVKDKLADVAGAATDKVKSATSGDDTVDSLNPDRIKVTEDSGPQGTLP
jgi:flagellar hook-length control protein FliK